MEYVNHSNHYGVKSKENSCITGSGAPTAETKGIVGLLYMDTDTGALYKCTAAADGVYTWVAAGGGTMTVTIDEEGMASHTSAEIYAHVQSGGTAYLEYEGGLVPSQDVYEDCACFGYADANGKAVYTWWVYDDGTIEEYGIGIPNVEDFITPPAKAEVGQTIVVSRVDDDGRPLAWECVDLPIVAKFSSIEQDETQYIRCTTHDPQDIKEYLLQQKSVLANVYIGMGEVRTVVCWISGNSLRVGDPWTDSGWTYLEADDEKWEEY